MSCNYWYEGNIRVNGLSSYLVSVYAQVVPIYPCAAAPKPVMEPLHPLLLRATTPQPTHMMVSHVNRCLLPPLITLV